MNLKGRAAATKPRIRAETRTKRLISAKERRHRTVEEWKRIVFSYECKFALRSKGQVYVWRTASTQYKPVNTIEKSISLFSFMSQGCISGTASRVLLEAPKRRKSADYVNLLTTASIDNVSEHQFSMDDVESR